MRFPNSVICRVGMFEVKWVYLLNGAPMPKKYDLLIVTVVLAPKGHHSSVFPCCKLSSHTKPQARGSGPGEKLTGRAVGVVGPGPAPPNPRSWPGRPPGPGRGWCYGRFSNMGGCGDQHFRTSAAVGL